MDMFSIFLISAKSNDITNIFVKSILVLKIAPTFIYDIIMSPEHFEIKKKIFASPITVKNRQLSTVPLNFDCLAVNGKFDYSRVWQRKCQDKHKSIATSLSCDAQKQNPTKQYFNQIYCFLNCPRSSYSTLRLETKNVKWC